MNRYSTEYAPKRRSFDNLALESEARNVQFRSPQTNLRTFDFKHLHDGSGKENLSGKRMNKQSEQNYLKSPRGDLDTERLRSKKSDDEIKQKALLGTLYDFEG